MHTACSAPGRREPRREEVPDDRPGLTGYSRPVTGSLDGEEPVTRIGEPMELVGLAERREPRIEVIHLRPTAWLVNGFGALIVALAAVYLLVWFAGGKQRPVYEWVRPAYLAFNFLGFAMPFLVIRDGNSAFGAAALWHAVQYIAIVWLYNDRRYRSGIDPQARKILLIKSTNHFYSSFSKIAAKIIYCAAGHPYPNTPATTNYRKAPRNIWPIVDDPFAE